MTANRNETLRKELKHLSQEVKAVSERLESFIRTDNKAEVAQARGQRK